MIFRKVNEAQMLGENVALIIKRSDDGAVCGRVIAMTVTHAGIEPVTNVAPILEAIRSASELAQVAKVSVVDVLDEDRLWQPSWGSLEND